MIFHSFGIFVCAHYVSLCILHISAPHLHVIYLTDIANFFLLLKNYTRNIIWFVYVCVYIYIYMWRFLFWFRSMSSTYGEIEIFPILLLRLPSSSFYLKRKRKKKKRKDTLNWSFFTFVYPRIHLIRSALQIVINTCFIYFGFVRNMKTKNAATNDRK
jgi:hypothetical protein